MLFSIVKQHSQMNNDNSDDNSDDNYSEFIDDRWDLTNIFFWYTIVIIFVTLYAIYCTIHLNIVLKNRMIIYQEQQKLQKEQQQQQQQNPLVRK